MSKRKVMITIEIGVGVPESVLEGMDRSNLSFEDTIKVLQAAMKDDKGVYHTSVEGPIQYEDEVL